MDMATHEKRILYNLLNKPAVRELPAFVDINIWLGGVLRNANGVLEYCGGVVYHKLCAWLKSLDVALLRTEVEDAMLFMYKGRVANNFTVWYKVQGDDEQFVYKVVESDEDIKALVEGRDLYERVTVFVEEFWEGRQGKKLGNKGKGKSPLRPKTKTEKLEAQPRPLKIGLSPTRRSPRFDFGPDVVILPPGHPDIPLCDRFSTPTKKGPNTKKHNKEVPPTKPTQKTSQTKNKKPPHATVPSVSQQKTPPRTPKSSLQNTETPPPSQTTTKLLTTTRSSPRFKQVARKHGTSQAGSSGKGVKKSSKGKGKKKKQQKVDEDCDFEPGWSSDSDFSDLDVDFVPEEEDFKAKERTDEFVQFNPKDLTKAVVDAFKKIKSNGAGAKQAEADLKFDEVQEPSYGSDDEVQEPTMPASSQQHQDNVILSQQSSAQTPQPQTMHKQQRRPPKLQVKSNAKVPPQS